MRNTFLEIFISLKNQKKNPNGSELQVKTNVCISIHLQKRTTSQQTLGQDNVYALKYRMIDRKNSIKDILSQ